MLQSEGICVDLMAESDRSSRVDGPTPGMLSVGDWRVDPASGEISRGGETNRLEARPLRLLLYLAERPGQVVSVDALLDSVWSGVAVTQDSVYQAVTSLRRLLGDDPKQPRYIATVPRLGYRMVARVAPCVDAPAAVATDRHASQPAVENKSSDMKVTPAPVERRRGNVWGWTSVALLCVAMVIILAVQGRRVDDRQAPAGASAPPPSKSVAVLPFLDLTEGMKNEEFADGITEELIDRLSKIPGFQVPAATSSFYFKGKQPPMAEVARSLGVAFVLDGSVRKSGTWVRVDARLTRAANGFIVWSETYDQPMSDILTIQDDIAGKAARAIQASISAAPGQSGTK